MPNEELKRGDVVALKSDTIKPCDRITYMTVQHVRQEDNQRQVDLIYMNREGTICRVTLDRDLLVKK